MEWDWGEFIQVGIYAVIFIFLLRKVLQMFPSTSTFAGEI